MDMSATAYIEASPESVWEFVADPANDVRWRTGVTESGLVTEPPLALGSEGFVRAGDIDGGWKVTAIEPGSSVDWDLIAGPYAGSGGYRLERMEAGTRFTLVSDVTPTGFYKLLGPLFGVIGRRQNRKDVDRLKALLEGRGP